MDKVDNKLTVHLAEYNALRQEILEMCKIYDNYINYEFIAIGAIVTLAISVLKMEKPIFEPSFIIQFIAIHTPLVMFIFFVNAVRMIYAITRAATYINQRLRPKIERIVENNGGKSNLLQWEVYLFTYRSNLKAQFRFFESFGSPLIFPLLTSIFVAILYVLAWLTFGTFIALPKTNFAPKPLLDGYYLFIFSTDFLSIIIQVFLFRKIMRAYKNIVLSPPDRT